VQPHASQGNAPLHRVALGPLNSERRCAFGAALPQYRKTHSSPEPKSFHHKLPLSTLCIAASPRPRATDVTGTQAPAWKAGCASLRRTSMLRRPSPYPPSRAQPPKSSMAPYGFQSSRMPSTSECRTSKVLARSHLCPLRISSFGRFLVGTTGRASASNVPRSPGESSILRFTHPSGERGRGTKQATNCTEAARDGSHDLKPLKQSSSKTSRLGRAATHPTGGKIQTASLHPGQPFIAPAPPQRPIKCVFPNAHNTAASAGAGYLFPSLPRGTFAKVNTAIPFAPVNNFS
jgi:hypothetical protein